MDLNSQIESILFFKGEAVSVKFLSGLFEKEESEILLALEVLKKDLQNRGVRLIQNGERVMLGTAPDAHGFIEKIKKEELSKDLGKASLETLSIVLYRGPVRKTQIDYIRGVNSGSILRNLLIRGLIEKKSDEENQRSFLYYPTFELLSYLGISKLEELPEYEKVRNELNKTDDGNEDGEIIEIDDN
ncbi:SMC-Scp complex subunit ScpB [Patescibacteria group bacterium]|nr:SMC-Scp complex subunit ScpB [Patescibacteria group bacterium]